MTCIICGAGSGSGYFYAIKDMVICFCGKHFRGAKNFDYSYRKIDCSCKQTPTLKPPVK